MWRPLRLPRGCSSAIPTRVQRFSTAQHAATLPREHPARQLTSRNDPLFAVRQHLRTGSTTPKTRRVYNEGKKEMGRIRREFQIQYKAGIDDDINRMAKKMMKISARKKLLDEARTTKNIKNVRHARLADVRAARLVHKAKRQALKKMTFKFRADTWGKVRSEGVVRNMVAEIRNGDWITMENMEQVDADFLKSKIDVPGLPAPGTYDTTEGIMRLSDTYFGHWKDPQRQLKKSDVKKEMTFQDGKRKVKGSTDSSQSASTSSASASAPNEGQVHERPIMREEIENDDEPKLDDIDLPDEALSAEERARLEKFKLANPDDDSTPSSPDTPSSSSSSSPLSSSSSPPSRSSSSSSSKTTSTNTKSSPYVEHTLDESSFTRWLATLNSVATPTDVRVAERLETKLHSYDDMGARLRAELSAEFVDDVDSMNRVELDAMIRYLDEQIGESLEQYSGRQKIVL